MKKLSCIIVDDEPMALALLKNYVSKTPYLDLKAECATAIEVLNFLNENAAVDVIFSDIQMPELNGMQLAKTLPKSTKLVFTTAFDHYAIEGYKVNAVDYLLKPFNYAEFLDAANKVLEIRSKETENIVLPEETKFYIFIKSEYKQIKIWLKEILYIEGMKDYVKFYLTTETKPILSLMTLKKLESELPKKQFMRIHRSYIIGLDKIESLERNQVLIGNERITVANQYKDDFDAFVSQNLM